jgi:hypothetical protein
MMSAKFNGTPQNNVITKLKNAIIINKRKDMKLTSWSNSPNFEIG